MVLIGYSGVWGKLIYEKNLKLKISCQTPFKNIKFILGPKINRNCLKTDTPYFTLKAETSFWNLKNHGPLNWPENNGDSMRNYLVRFIPVSTSLISGFTIPLINDDQTNQPARGSGKTSCHHKSNPSYCSKIKYKFYVSLNCGKNKLFVFYWCLFLKICIWRKFSLLAHVTLEFHKHNLFQLFTKNIILYLIFASRISLNLSSTLDNVDLIYNGLSDKYETLYPYNQYGAENDGAMTLLTQEQLRKGEVNMVTIFISWSSLCFPMIS